MYIEVNCFSCAGKANAIERIAAKTTGDLYLNGVESHSVEFIHVWKHMVLREPVKDLST